MSHHVMPLTPPNLPPTAPHCAACTELYLGSQGLEQLDGFTPLVNLERLWLDGNKLRAISGLEANVRLKELYVQVGALEARRPASCCVACGAGALWCAGSCRQPSACCRTTRW